MARKPTARPPQEHLALCTRMLGQVDADPEYSGRRRAEVKRLLGDLIEKFKAETVKR